MTRCPQCSREYEATFGTEATLRVCEHVRFPDVEVTPLTIPAERRFLSQDEIRNWADSKFNKPDGYRF